MIKTVTFCFELLRYVMRIIMSSRLKTSAMECTNTKKVNKKNKLQMKMKREVIDVIRENKKDRL